MKKMIMALAAVAVAAVANAASVDWATAKNTITMYDGSVASGVTAYILNADSSAYSTLIAALTDGSATAENIATFDAYVGSGNTGSGKKAGLATGTASSSDFAAGNTYNLVYVIFDKDGAQDYFYTSSVAAGKAWVTADEQTLATSAEWATDSAAGTWTAVQSVPEPTSGLLLLLGMAGLALKRKRA